MLFKNTINIDYVLLYVLLIFRDYVEICNSSIDGFNQHVSYILLHHSLVQFQILVFNFKSNLLLYADACISISAH